MTIAILIVVALVIVVVGGLFFYKVAQKSQDAVPKAAEPGLTADQVVGTDDQGRDITESQEQPEAPRDAAPFESLLQDEIHDLGMKQPPSDEPG